MVGSSLLAPRPPQPRRLETQTAPPPSVPEPVQVGERTEELRHYDGSDPEKPLFMAIKGQIYDVSQSRMFYGPGGHMHCLLVKTPAGHWPRCR